MKISTKTLIMLMLSAALILTACANQQPATQPPAAQNEAAVDGIVAEGKLKPIHAANLTFQTRGQVEEISVQIGDAVQKGDVLARLSNSELATAQLAAATLELHQAQQAYDQLMRTADLEHATSWTNYQNAQIARANAERAWEDLNIDGIEDRIEDAEADLKDLDEELQDAQEEFDKYKDLDEDNDKRQTAEDALETAQENYNEALRELDEIRRERDNVRAALDAALATEAEAKYQFELTLEGPNAEKFTLVSARLENAKAQVAAAEEALNNYQIVAPFDGVVAEVNVEVGEQVGVETRAVSIVDATAWIVETTDITELEVVDLAVGQKVTFTADALPDVEMTGVVTEISAAAVVQGGDVIYTVRIATDDVDARVRWGMTVEIIFTPVE